MTTYLLAGGLHARAAVCLRIVAGKTLVLLHIWPWTTKPLGREESQQQAPDMIPRSWIRGSSPEHDVRQVVQVGVRRMSRHINYVSSKMEKRLPGNIG
jgi:hypothetical protein